MASVVVTLKIMPESPEVELGRIKDRAFEILDKEMGQGDRKEETVPVAFGLKALNLTFVMDEAKGSPDPVADMIAELEGVQSCEVSDVRRAVG